MDERVLQTLREGVRLLARRELRNPADVDDVVQETMSRVLATLRAGRQIQNPGGFARTIARNVIADLYRGHKHDAGPSPAAADPPDPHPDPLARAVQDEEETAVRAALDQLSPPDRELLRLCFVEEMKPGEVARARGEPPERVRKRLQRALERLREIYLRLRPGHDSRADATDEIATRRRVP